jgi:hypothetical protein
MFEDLLRRLSLDVSALANTLRLLFASPLWNGRLVTATLLSGQTTVDVIHGLGRPARAALVAGSSAAGAFTVDLVDEAATVTARASSAPGSDVTLLLWVF